MSILDNLKKEYCGGCIHLRHPDECEGCNVARAAITNGIPLGRLEAICDAERDGRCVVLP